METSSSSWSGNAHQAPSNCKGEALSATPPHRLNEVLSWHFHTMAFPRSYHCYFTIQTIQAAKWLGCGVLEPNVVGAGKQTSNAPDSQGYTRITDRTPHQTAKDIKIEWCLPLL